ncbi:MAG: hypothetical protein ABIP91_01420 [Sphingomicrobium sp.]
MILLMLAAAPAALQSPPASAATDCPRTTSHYAVRPGQRVEPRKLTELPSANAYAAMYRHVGGCEVPVVVRYGIGNRR